MERRILNLMRELELKDIQIKSQEQMINRRNKELDEFKSKTINFASGNRTLTSQNNFYVNTTENDQNRESLGRDRNPNLMNNNQFLNSIPTLINRELDLTKNSKFEEEMSHQFNV